MAAHKNIEFDIPIPVLNSIRSLLPAKYKVFLRKCVGRRSEQGKEQIGVICLRC